MFLKDLATLQETFVSLTCQNLKDEIIKNETCAVSLVKCIIHMHSLYSLQIHGLVYLSLKTLFDK